MTDIIPRLCSIVIATDLKSLYRALAETQTTLIELRLDYVQDITAKDIATLKSYCKQPAIVTCRSTKHGGQFKGTDLDQIEILPAANEAGFEYIDIDVSLSEAFKCNNITAQRVVSYHDFCSTPSLDELNAIKDEMLSQQADIMKFATQTHHQEDSLSLFKFLLDKKVDEKMIVIGMGKTGRITRLLGPWLGSYLTFCNTGQIDPSVGSVSEKKLRDIFTAISQFIDG